MFLPEGRKLLVQCPRMLTNTKFLKELTCPQSVSLELYNAVTKAGPVETQEVADIFSFNVRKWWKKHFSRKIISTEKNARAT